MKKAGIILGSLAFIIAIVLCIFVLKNPNKDNNNNPDGSSVNSNISDTNNPNENQNQPVNNGNQNQGQNNQDQNIPPINTQPANTEPTVIEKTVIKEISGVKTIEDSSLGNPVSEKSVVVRIINKRILLVDENTESMHPKMLTCCFDVLTPENNQIILFITQSVYNAYNINDLLTVKYNIYTNDKGIQFPLVIEVTGVSNNQENAVVENNTTLSEING